MAREAFKDGDGNLAAAQAVFASTQNQPMEAGSDSRACCKRIPKTIVYIDSIKQIIQAVRVLTTLLIQAGCSKVSAASAI